MNPDAPSDRATVPRGPERARRPRPAGLDPRVRTLRWLSLATVVATYLLLVLGSTVRVTDSGMGCPGWPLCSGKVGPISQFHPLMEQSHRYLATIVTVLIVLVALLARRAGRVARPVVGPATAGVAMIAVQVVLGAITVFANNAPFTVALHLVVGLGFLGVVTLSAVATFAPADGSWSALRDRPAIGWAALGALATVIVSGTLVVDGGAQDACRSRPLCFGSHASDGLVAIQLIHRGVVLVGATLVVVFLVGALRSSRASSASRGLAVAGLALLCSQIAVGLVDASLGAPAGLADVHLALGSALWCVLVGAVALARAPGAARQRAKVLRPAL